MPNSKFLRQLNLNSNKITNPGGLEHAYTPKLNTLDLGNNSIKFGTYSAFNEFVMTLSRFSDLKTLSIGGNNFMSAHDRDANLGGADVRREFCERLK